MSIFLGHPRHMPIDAGAIIESSICSPRAPGQTHESKHSAVTCSQDDSRIVFDEGVLLNEGDFPPSWRRDKVQGSDLRDF